MCGVNSERLQARLPREKDLTLKTAINICIADEESRKQLKLKILQTDLANLEYWSYVSRLSFNQSKCRHQRITRKIAPVTSSYKLGNYLISTTENEKDLGVWLLSKLTWKKQVYPQTVKANKLLGHIRRNTTLIRNTAARRSMHLALVRSHFGYASQVWAPQSIEPIHKLERAQRRANKYILNLPFSTDIEYKKDYKPYTRSRYVTGTNT